MPQQLIVEGDNWFGLGVDSAVPRSMLPPGSAVFTENMILSDGRLTTRPGIRSIARWPAGRLQGGAFFPQRTGQPPSLLFAVSGAVYVSHYPYSSYAAVPGGITLSPDALEVHFEACTQYVESNEDGSLKLLNPPRQVMVLQDGRSPAAVYDGVEIAFQYGEFAIPQGTAMKWDGLRLWVLQGEKLFASDIAYPQCFSEQSYNQLGGCNYYILPEAGTALALTPGVATPQLLAFTRNTTTLFASNIADRTQWASVENFQQTIFPTVGCSSARSLVVQGGQLWWYAQHGLTRLDSAALSQQTSRIDYMDREMRRSKKLIAHPERVASACFGDYLLVSVPSASRYNTQTWVQAASVIDKLTENSSPAWVGIWTGVRPVQWLTFSWRGADRLFCLSRDPDGSNRLYEAFSGLRDNSVDFPWSIELRGLGVSQDGRKKFRWAEYDLRGILGQTDIRIRWAGVNRGSWKTCATESFKAAEGSLDTTQEYADTDFWSAYRAQSRTRRTQDVRELEEPTNTSAGAEAAELETVDRAFLVRFDGSGPCELASFRATMELLPAASTGEGEPDAGTEAASRFDGETSTDPSALASAPEVFQSTQKVEVKIGKYAGVATAVALSIVSTADAAKRATQTAAARAEFKLATARGKHVWEHRTEESELAAAPNLLLTYSPPDEFVTVGSLFLDHSGYHTHPQTGAPGPGYGVPVGTFEIEYKLPGGAEWLDYSASGEIASTSLATMLALPAGVTSGVASARIRYVSVDGVPGEWGTATVLLH